MNLVAIQGRLTRDPETKEIKQGTTVTEFTVAVDDGWGDNKKTAFIRTTAWNKTGEMVAKHFKKGDGIIVNGKLNQSSWDDKDGNKREKTGVTAMNITFPMSRPSQGGATGGASAKAFTAPADNSSIPF